MKYLPFEHIVYTTNFSEQEVTTRLSNYIESRKVRMFKNNPTKEYEGFISDNKFEINRIIKGRNSFLPQIIGTIQKFNEETQIEVKMQLHWAVKAFLIFWCSSVIFFLIITLMKGMSIEILFPISMLLFAYLLTMLGFKSESKKSKNDLKRIFEARISN